MVPNASLSPRERQTFDLLLRGHSEKEVAAALSLSRHTVHVHVKSIYRRFEVGTRAELMALFIAREHRSGAAHAGGPVPRPSRPASS